MQLHVSSRIPGGELPAAMNPGNSSPFGIVSFGDTDLYLHSDEDCDRLIRAAARIKAMRATLGMPHVFAPGGDYNCETCGMLAGWKDHLAPVPEDEADAAAVLAEAIKNGTPVIVTDDEPALEGTVTAPPQDAPYAEVIPARPELRLEIRDQADGTVRLGDGSGPVMMLPPELGEGYWTYRVRLSDKQAVVGFPKFGTIGVGFAVEEDWNTNLPYTCETEEIFKHISHNRGDDSISDDACREAIRMIREAATAERDGSRM